MGSQFDVERAKRCIGQPRLDVLSDESSRRLVMRDLNTQFASWIQSQLQNHPDELWEDGVQDFLNRAKNVMEVYGGGVKRLRTNAVERGGIANIPSEDAQTAPLFGTDKSSLALFRAKPGRTFLYKPLFPSATTASSGTPWRPAVLFNNKGPFTFRVSEVSVPGIGNANAFTSNEPDGESQSIRVTKTMVTDPTLDDDRWGFFVKYKRKFWFEENDYDVPESYFYQNGEEIQPNTIELVKRFLKQVRESRGYDVDCCPPRMFESPFLPLPLEELRKGTRDFEKIACARIVEAAECAIQKISEETSHSYKLVEVEKAVMTGALVYFMTLTAEEEDGGSVKTIQAAVFHPIGGSPVLREWRFKPITAH